MKLRGGTLLYAVFILLLITAASSAVIISSYFNRRIILGQEAMLRNEIDLRSAIQYGLSSAYPLKNNTGLNLRLFDSDESQPVTISSEPWGMFYLLKASRSVAHHSSVRLALVGSVDHRSSPLALYLTDQRKPLSVCGETAILGKATLPSAGLKRAYIEGQHFTGTMPSGEVSNSGPELPALSPDLLHHLKNLLGGNFDSDSAAGLPVPGGPDSIHNAWKNRTLVIHCAGQTRLTGLKLSGKIIVYSRQPLHISNCRFDGPVIVAPKLVITDQPPGSAQFFATDSIVVSGSTGLAYPSAIGLISDPMKQDRQPAVLIGGRSDITGDILLSAPNRSSRYPGLLSVGREVRITGIVYAHAQVELKGNINGSLYCREFILRTPSSVYSNHLLNARIDRYGMPENFVGTLMLENAQKEIIKWLN